MRDYMFSPALGDRPGVRNFGIIVTDGVSNIRNWRTIPEAHKAQVITRPYLNTLLPYHVKAAHHTVVSGTVLLN